MRVREEKEQERKREREKGKVRTERMTSAPFNTSNASFDFFVNGSLKPCSKIKTWRFVAKLKRLSLHFGFTSSSCLLLCAYNILLHLKSRSLSRQDIQHLRCVILLLIGLFIDSVTFRLSYCIFLVSCFIDDMFTAQSVADNI